MRFLIHAKSEGSAIEQCSYLLLSLAQTLLGVLCELFSDSLSIEEMVEAITKEWLHQISLIPQDFDRGVFRIRVSFQQGLNAKLSGFSSTSGRRDSFYWDYVFPILSKIKGYPHEIPNVLRVMFADLVYGGYERFLRRNVKKAQFRYYYNNYAYFIRTPIYEVEVGQGANCTTYSSVSPTSTLRLFQNLCWDAYASSCDRGEREWGTLKSPDTCNLKAFKGTGSWKLPRVLSPLAGPLEVRYFDAVPVDCLLLSFGCCHQFWRLDQGFAMALSRGIEGKMALWQIRQRETIKRCEDTWESVQSYNVISDPSR